MSRKDRGSRKCPECSAEPDASMGATGQTNDLLWGEGSSFSPPCLPVGREQEELRVFPLHSQLLLHVPGMAWLHSLRTFCCADKMIPQRRIVSAAATLPRVSGEVIEERTKAKVQLHAHDGLCCTCFGVRSHRVSWLCRDHRMLTGTAEAKSCWFITVALFYRGTEMDSEA